jgi:hypothetical protein
MDTLKLSKWKVIIILFFSALFFINRECKKNEEERLRQNIIADRPLKTHIQLFPVNNQRNRWYLVKIFTKGIVFQIFIFKFGFV